MSFQCQTCGEHAPYSCDAPGEVAGKVCGRLCCPGHCVPMVEGAVDRGKGFDVLCEEHGHLQQQRKAASSVKFKKKKSHHLQAPGPWQEEIDPTVEYAVLTVDGKDYALAWSFRAIAASEALCRASLKSELNLMQGIASFLLDTANAEHYLGLLHAALSLAYPNVGLAEVAQLIRIDTMPDIRLALIESYNLSMPEKKRMQVVVVPADGNPPGAPPPG